MVGASLCLSGGDAMASWLGSVRLATLGNLTVSGGGAPLTPATLDGIAVLANNRVLVKDQSDPRQNGIWVATTSPNPMTRAPDVFDPESVVRVSEGDRNAHTAWALRAPAPITVGVDDLPWLRQDVSTYSFDSIAELQKFWQALPEATATVAGFYAPGDKGGGDFTFLGLPESARVTSAAPAKKTISAVVTVDGKVAMTAVAHGLGDAATITSTYIEGLTGLADGVYFVKVVDADTITLNGYNLGVSLVGPASLQYVRVVTAAAHGRASWERVYVAGVVPAGGAPDVRGATDLCGVIDATTLSLPVPNTGVGSYSPGVSAMVGDGGITVPATDAAGSVGGLWQRDRAAHVDVKWFGAKSDWDGAAGTDNLPAFHAALGAIVASDVTKKLVADGQFYLSNTLVLVHTVVFEGTGQNDYDNGGGARSAAGTLLAFPANVTGIRVRGGTPHDYPESSAERTVLRNLTIYCKERDQMGHGVYSTTQIQLANVIVQRFGEHGVYVVGAATDIDLGHADGSLFEDCTAAQCRLDGFHFAGADASVCVISRCSAVVNERHGFFDASRVNTYVGCHSQNNLGRQYRTEGNNSSCFVGCYREDPRPPEDMLKDEFYGAVSILGGSISKDYIEPDCTAFILDQGVASRAPFVYENERGPTRIQTFLGSFDGAEMHALKLLTSALDTNDSSQNDLTTLTYLYEPGTPRHRWWGLVKNSSAAQHVLRLPTVQANARQQGPWFPNGFFFGNEDFPAMLCFIAAPAPPDTQSSGAPLTYDHGDVVWQSAPIPGGPTGRVCTVAGTRTILNGGNTTGSIAQGSNALTVSSAVGLVVGQYLAIAGVTGKRKIVAIAGVTVTLDEVADAAAGPGAEVSYGVPEFETLGKVGGAGELYVPMGDADVTLTAAQSAYEVIVFTGPNTETRSATLAQPARDVDAYVRIFRNATGHDVVVGVGAGATVAVPDQSTAHIGFDNSNGAFPVSVITTAGTQTLRAATFTANGTWVAPTNVSQVTLIGFGGGGGGGGGSGGAGTGVLDTYPGGGGGGGGAQQATASVAVVPGTAYTVTIGAGGAGGAGGGSNSNGVDGGGGGDTTFGAVATFTGATGGLGGKRVANVSPQVYLLAPGGGAPGAYRPVVPAATIDPTKFFSSGWGGGGDGIDNKPMADPRNGGTSVQGFPGGTSNGKGSDAGNNRGGGPGGGGGAGPAGQGGAAGPGADGVSAGSGNFGSSGNAAGPLGVSTNTGGGGGGGGAGGSAPSGSPGGTGGSGGQGGSGKLTIVYVA